MSASSSEHNGAVESFVARAEADVENCRERLRLAIAIERFLKALNAELAAGHPSEALRVLRSNRKPILLLRERSADPASTIDALEAALVPEVEAAFGGLVHTFPEAVRSAGLELDATSRHPKYSLESGFIRVQFDNKTLETRVQPRDGRRATLGVDLPVVIEHVQSEVDRLFGKPLEVSEMLELIEGAYRAVASDSEAGSGAVVPINKVVAEIVKDGSFRADEFNVMLSRLVRSSDPLAKRVHLDNTRDPKNGLLLWNLDARGYYGYVGVAGAGV